MKKSNSTNHEDQELQQFFQELRSEEAKDIVPDLESMLATLPEKERSSPMWRYVAAIALLIIGIGTYQWHFNAQESRTEVMEIVISYETPAPAEKDESENLAIPGMDQWQSETDILLTGL